MIVGDFNRHHPWWNSTADPARTSEAETLVDWLAKSKANLLVDAEEVSQNGGTFFRSNLKGKSVIDLAFYTSFRRFTWGNWRCIEPTGSDHEAIAFEATVRSSYPLPITPSPTASTSTIQPTFNYKKAKWELFSKLLRVLELYLQNQVE